MVRKMQQQAGRAQTTSYADDFTGNTRCFTERTEDQKYGMLRFACTVYFSMIYSPAGKKTLNQPPSKQGEIQMFIAELTSKDFHT